MECSQADRGNEQWPKTSLVLNVVVCRRCKSRETRSLITLKETAQVPGKMTGESPNCRELVVEV
eukprot:3627004-Pyramimonas_sp.AAC.1